MIERIIQFSIKNKFIVGLFVVALIGWGTYSLTRLPIDAIPDTTNNQVQVITTSDNLSTQEIEQFITAPVELEMANLPGVKDEAVARFFSEQLDALKQRLQAAAAKGAAALGERFEY